MDYFDISGWHDAPAKIEVWLEEKNYMERSDYKSGTVVAHGFTDFSYTYDDLTAEGTKLTPEFVAF